MSSPHDARTESLLAAIRAGEPARALAEIEALSDDAVTGRVGAVEVRALAAMGQHEAARERGVRHLAAAREAGDDAGVAHLAFALAVLDTHERPVVAMRHLRTCIEASPPATLCGEAWAMLGDVRSRSGDAVGARSAVAAAAPLVAEGLSRQRLDIVAVMASLRAGALDDAEEQLAAMAPDALVPRARELWWEARALIALTRGEGEAALAAVDALADQVPDPRTQKVVALRAVVLQELGRYDQAEATLLSLDAPSEVDLVNLASVRIHLGRLDEAEAALEPLRQAAQRAVRFAAAVGLLRISAHRGVGARWDLLWRTLPAFWGNAPGDAAREVERAARAAEAAAERGEARWAARAARARARVAALASAAGATRLQEQAMEALAALAAGGAPVPLASLLLTERLGAGRQGEVWRATREDGSAVAVKVLTASGRSGRHRDLAELRLAAMLDHPNVARVLAFGRVPEAVAPLLQTDGGTRWVATPLARGGSMQALVGRLPWSLMRPMLLGLLDALSHVHARGLLHLDVKPDNVLLDGDRRPRAMLTDFGVALAMSRATGRVPVAGTPAYMAPEQFLGDGRALGPWTDLYAVGGTAITLATGRLPFGGSTVDELRDAHQRLPPPRIEAEGRVPEGFDRWIAGLMAKVPRDRYQRAADAARDLLLLTAGRDQGLEASPLDPLAPSTSSLPTLVLEPERRARSHAQSAAADPDGAPAVQRPPIPSDWRPAVRPRAPEDPRAALELLRLRQVPFVGREAERDRLWGALREVAAEQAPRLVRVQGPLGIGTTRLAEWLGTRSSELGLTHAWTTTHGLDGDPTSGLQPMLARELRARRGESERLAEGLVGEGWPEGFAEELADVACAVTPPSGAAVRDVVRRAFLHLAAERTVVWIIDDAHLGAEAQRLLPEVLALSAPILVIATTRSETPAIAGVVPHLRIELEPLDDDARRALVERLLPVTPETALRLVDAFGGWPDRVVQEVLGLSAEGVLVPDGRSVVLTRADLRGSTMSDRRWEERLRPVLEVLDGPDRAAAELLAVLGGCVAGATWRAACRAAGVGEGERAVEVLQSHQLLLAGEEAGERILRLSHPGVRHALLDQARRAGHLVALHEAAAEVTAADPAQRARHLHVVGRPREAAETLASGMQEALSCGRVVEALPLAEQLLEVLGEVGRSDRLWLDYYMGAAQLRWELGDLESQEPLFRQMIAHAEQQGWEDGVASAHVQLAQGSDERSVLVRHLAEARRRYRKLGDADGLARCDRAQGRFHHRRGELEDALVHYQAAAEGFRHPKSKADTWRFQATVLTSLGRLDEARERLEAALELATASGAGVDRPHLRISLANLARAEGRLDEAIAHCREGLALHPVGIQRSSLELNLVTCLWLVGDDTAPAEARRLRASHPRDGGPVDLAMVFTNLPAVVLGDAEPWAATLSRARQLAAATRMRDPDMEVCVRVAARRAQQAGLDERVSDLEALLASLR